MVSATAEVEQWLPFCLTRVAGSGQTATVCWR